MWIFIDESGIHKFSGHSTFVLVYIEAENYELIERTVLHLEKELKIPYLHWSETVWKIRQIFLENLLKLDFKVKIAVVKNPINPAKQLDKIFTQMIIEQNIKGIFIDGKKPKSYEYRIKKILRDKGTSVNKVKTISAHKMPGIRFADLIAGLVRSCYDGKNLLKIEEYYKQLQKKIVVISGPDT